MIYSKCFKRITKKLRVCVLYKLCQRWLMWYRRSYWGRSPTPLPLTLLDSFNKVVLMDLATTAPVLVTGGSGFIAGHLINQLLQRGYKVRASVRSKEHSSYDHLLKLPNAEKNLEIVEAELTNASSWDASFSGGVEYVFHVASPHILKPEDPESTLIAPAVGGTQTILEMCQRTESVKKLIFTSCMSAVSDDFDNNREYDESDWNTLSSLTRNSYAYSKSLAEMGVINFASRPECRFKIATILPCIVLGPSLSNRLSFSHKFLLSFLNKQIRGMFRMLQHMFVQLVIFIPACSCTL